MVDLRGVGASLKAPGGICADMGQSYQSIERMAALVRRLIAPEVPENQALPGLKLFERLDRCVVRTERGKVLFEPAVEDLPPGVEGCTRYDKDRNRIIVSLSEASYSALEQDNRRARFSFTHEVGHAVLHFRELMRAGAIAHQMAALRRGAPLEHPKFMDTEWQANAFGAALLMPASGLGSVEKQHGYLDSFLITVQFKVSDEAARYRLECFTNRRDELLNP